MNASRHVRTKLTVRLAGIGIGLVMLSVLIAMPSAIDAQSSPDKCAPPKYAGITHCVEDDGKTQVVIVDLTNTKVRLETVLAAYRQPIIGIPVECTDVNIPRWALYGAGCALPNTDLYPHETVEEMAQRYAGAVVAINTDYFGPGYDHGPEGLTIKNGQRFDGWRKGDCDGALNHDPQNSKSTPTPCESNDTKRTSMTISRNKSVEIGRKRFADVDDPSLWSDRFYNAVGGGPLIVEAGRAVLASAQACAKEKLPDGEGACLRSAQTAGGVTKDNRLVLVTASNQNAYTIGEMLAKHYRVETAMKFDGGGSAQMWYDSKAYYGTNEKRKVVESLVVFSVPLQDYGAEVVKQSDMSLLDPRQKTKAFIEMTNTGAKTWSPDAVALVNTNGQTFGLPNRLLLKSNISPGQGHRWDVEITAPDTQGPHFSEWQLQQGGKAFGPKITMLVTVTPDVVRDWRKQFERWLADVQRQIADAFLRQLCGGTTIFIFLAGVVWAVHYRRKYLS